MSSRLSRLTVVPVLAVALLAVPSAADATTATPLPAPPSAVGAASAPAPAGARVLAISVDGLNTDAIRQLGTDRAPAFHRLLDEGAGTLNARTAYEQTVTMPNHTGMMTGRRINAARGGHGVTWDNDRKKMTVKKAAGHTIKSVFNVVHRAKGSTALFSTKPKFALYQRSWPKAIDRFTVDEKQKRLVRKARRDLVRTDRDFTFLHFSLPDRAGHAHGGMSKQYLNAVHRTDTLLATLLRAVDRHSALQGSLTIVLTADHGFAPGERNHAGRTLIANYRIPFLTWGRAVSHGDLYDLNADYRDPGTKRPSYAAARQPVRNGDLGNLSLDLLGLGAIPGSTLDADQDLDVS